MFAVYNNLYFFTKCYLTHLCIENKWTIKESASQPESLQALEPQCHHNRGVAVPSKDQDSWNGYQVQILRGHQSFPHNKTHQGWAGIPVPVHSQEWKPLIPFPELWEWIFSFPSRSRISGMLFFHSLPVPELWEWFFFIPFPFPNCGNGFFSFPSRSRIVGMDFFNSLPIPEFAISQTGIKTGIGLL